MRFYFTYGTEGHPFFGGWTEVEAPDLETACGAFRVYHPNGIDNLLSCCAVYTEEEFKQTSMYGPAGNYGHRCHETITVRREICDRESAAEVEA